MGVGLGLGVKWDPQSAPSFTAIPGGHGYVKAGFLSCNLHCFREEVR